MTCADRSGRHRGVRRPVPLEDHSVPSGFRPVEVDRSPQNTHAIAVFFDSSRSDILGLGYVTYVR